MGQRDPSRTAVEQHPSELVLQQLHLAADRGLGDVQALRGPGEAALLGHGPEHVELSDVHGASQRGGVPARRAREARARYALAAWNLPRGCSFEMDGAPPRLVPLRRVEENGARVRLGLLTGKDGC